MLTMAAAAALNSRSCARHLHSAENGSSDGEGTINANPLKKAPPTRTTAALYYRWLQPLHWREGSMLPIFRGQLITVEDLR